MKIKYSIAIVSFLVLGIFYAKYLDNTKTKFTTLFHENGQLIKKAIDTSLIFKNGSIKNEHINSVTVFSLDSIIFDKGNPDYTIFSGSKIKLNFHDGDSHTKDAANYTLFTAYHLTYCIDYYNSLFENKLDFNSQKNYKNIDIYLGNASYLSDPKQFILTTKSEPSPTLIYHEIGHRALWLIEDDLKINLGGPNNFLHLGLLEYFTASIADHPIIMENVFPNSLVRNVEKKVIYPNDFISVRSTLDLLYEAYTSDSNESWHKKYYDLYDSYGAILDSIPDGHRSAMMIAHPLWKLRQDIGSIKADKLIATSLLNLSNFTPNRQIYWSGEKNPKEQIEWYDLIYSLVQTDKLLFDGSNAKSICQIFKETGYDVDLIRL